MTRRTSAAVMWSGTFVGLQPALADDASQGATGVAPASLDDLLADLDDDNTFVAAHVLLTRLTGVVHESSPTWNGLVVELDPDGTAHVDPAQRGALSARWRRWAATEPRPDRLPDPDQRPD